MVKGGTADTEGIAELASACRRVSALPKQRRSRALEAFRGRTSRRVSGEGDRAIDWVWCSVVKTAHFRPPW